MYRRYLQTVNEESSEPNENNNSVNGYCLHQPVSCRKTSRKLILHFDARNTVFVADHSSRISVEQALNTYIAGVVWGTYKEDGQWECISKDPTLCTPIPGGISMYKLMEKDIVKVPSDRAELRQRLGDFTQTDAGRRFVSYFHHHLDLLKWKDKAADSHLTVTGLDGCLYHYLIPSFLHLITHLYAKKLDFAIIIRTFGRDAPHILKGLSMLVDGLHPDFPDRIPVPVNDNVEHLNRQGGGFEYTFTGADGGKVTLDCERDIYEHWNACRGVIGVVDDFVHWQSNDYHFSASKPLWFDPDDHRHQHIMFDDNIRVDDEDNILNLCRLRSQHDPKENGSASNHGLSPDDARHFENVFFVQADLLESTSKKTYFIDQTDKCVDNLDRLRELNPHLNPR